MKQDIHFSNSSGKALAAVAWIKHFYLLVVGCFEFDVSIHS